MKYAVLVSSSWLIGCHEPNEDPCKALHATSADFTIMEDDVVAKSLGWHSYACDTVAGLSARFTAKDSSASSYSWQIGAGTYTTRSVKLFFPDYFLGQSVPITLILTKKPNTNCFPKDNGIDTVTKKVYFVDGCTNSLIKGTFLGYNATSPKDTFSVRIDLCKPNPYPYQTGTGSFINGLLTGCNLFIGDTGNYLGYKELLFFSGGSICGSGGIYGMAIVGPNRDQITINYSYYTDLTTNTLVKQKFIGTRKTK